MPASVEAIVLLSQQLGWRTYTCKDPDREALIRVCDEVSEKRTLVFLHTNDIGEGRVTCVCNKRDAIRLGFHPNNCPRLSVEAMFDRDGKYDVSLERVFVAFLELQRQPIGVLIPVVLMEERLYASQRYAIA